MQLPNGFKVQDVTELSKAQLSSLVWIPRLTSPLSMIAISMIILSIYRRRTYQSVYGRLMLCICSSLMIFLFTWMLAVEPVPYSVNELGRGNSRTCVAQGLTSFIAIISANLYELMLMAYFSISVHYGVRDDKFQYYEKWVHLAVFVFCATGGVAGLMLKVFNPGGVGLARCFVSDFPPACSKEDFYTCQRGERSSVFGRVTFMGPGLLLYVFCNLCVLSVYFQVRKRVKESKSRFGNSTFRNFRTVEIRTFLFSLMFFLTQICPLSIYTFAMNKSLRGKELKVYPCQVTVDFLMGVQGVLLFVVNVFPRYRAIVQRNRETSRWVVLRHAVFSRKESDKITIQKSSTSAHGSASQFSSGRERVKKNIPLASTGYRGSAEATSEIALGSSSADQPANREVSGVEPSSMIGSAVVHATDPLSAASDDESAADHEMDEGNRPTNGAGLTLGERLMI